jgi:hypothetical protein
VTKEISDYVKSIVGASESSLKTELSASETRLRDEITASEKRLQKEIDDIKRPAPDPQPPSNGRLLHSEPTKALRAERVRRRRYPCCCPPWWWDRLPSDRDTFVRMEYL